ncbi:hypothetical protein Fmac_018844 [Flemingia macrophylla]|uniref:FBD domain-containing protein n=1 Tax=Flemingia macrophylla TaxID=520843 RepID=A0ABD1M6T0_9FABA
MNRNGVINELRFNDMLCKTYKENKTCFVQFVNSVPHRLNASTIQSLSLSLKLKHDSRHVNDLISAVLNRGVKDLCIKSSKIIDIDMHSLLKSPNLEKLVLYMDGLVIRVPTIFCLPSLTVLDLFRITLTCDPSNRLQNLNLNLPVLRTYEAHDCTWLKFMDVTFEVPLLEVLSIKHTRLLKFSELRTKIKFRATRLTQFTYDSYMLEDTFSLELDPSSANITSVNIHPRKFEGENVHTTALLAYKLLKQFHSNMERVEFKRSAILYLVKDSLVTDSLKFEMLSYLELEHVRGEILLMFFKWTPFLKTLILQVLINFEEELLDSQLVPPCFESNLQEVHFGRLNGDEHEMRFLKYVLENALVLETAKVSQNFESIAADSVDDTSSQKKMKVVKSPKAQI